MNRKLLLPLALAALALPARAAIDLNAIKPNGFARGVVFTVDGYEANRPPLTNFPVLVRISETGISDFDYEDVYSHTDKARPSRTSLSPMPKATHLPSTSTHGATPRHHSSGPRCP